MEVGDLGQVRSPGAGEVPCLGGVIDPSIQSLFFFGGGGSSPPGRVTRSADHGVLQGRASFPSAKAAEWGNPRNRSNHITATKLAKTHCMDNMAANH